MWLACALAATGCPARPSGPPTGESLFLAHCAACHRADGRGLAGFPALDRTWLAKGSAIRAVLMGLEGPIEIEGREHDRVMPPLGMRLTDAQVAAILTHARGALHGLGPVTEDEVAAVRKSIAGRQVPFRAGDLRAFRGVEEPVGKPATGTGAVRSAQGSVE